MPGGFGGLIKRKGLSINGRRCGVPSLIIIAPAYWVSITAGSTLTCGPALTSAPVLYDGAKHLAMVACLTSKYVNIARINELLVIRSMN